MKHEADLAEEILGISSMAEARKLVRAIQADTLREAANMSRSRYAHHFDHSHRKAAGIEIAEDLELKAQQLERK